MARPTNRSETGAIRVLHVIPGAPEGASMVFARRLVAALAPHGVHSETFHLMSRNAPLVILREARRFRSATRTFDPDLIHAQYGTMTAIFAAFCTKRSLVVTYRGSDLNPTPSLGPTYSMGQKLLSQLAATRAKGIICVSEELRDRLWWGRDRTTILPSGVDTAVFHPLARDSARAQLGWPPDDPVLLFNAGLHPRVKRLDLAEEVARNIVRVEPRLRLVVMAGNVEPALVPVYMNAADCLLVTSDFEGSPTVVQEAMACRLPVVSVDVGDVRAALRGVTPGGVYGRDTEALAAAVVGVIAIGRRSDGDSRMTEFSTDNVARRTVDVYRRVLLRSRRVKGGQPA